MPSATVEKTGPFAFIKGKMKANREAVQGYKFVLPAVIFMLVTSVYPSLYAIRVSLTDWSLGNPVVKWVGLKNYVSFFQQPACKSICQSTFLFLIGTLVSVLVIGMLLALALNQNIKFRGMFRSTMVMPWTLTAIIAGVMWRWMLVPDLGVLNYFLEKIGIVISWFDTPKAALATLIIVESWRSNGYSAMMILSAMQGIDVSVYEAAKVDGATRLETFFYITLPLLMPSLQVLTIILTIRILNLVEVITVVTGGGPFRSTETLALHMYKESFQYLHFGPAAAVGGIILIINLILVVAYMRVWLKQGEV